MIRAIKATRPKRAARQWAKSVAGDASVASLRGEGKRASKGYKGNEDNEGCKGEKCGRRREHRVSTGRG